MIGVYRMKAYMECSASFPHPGKVELSMQRHGHASRSAEFVCSCQTFGAGRRLRTRHFAVGEEK